LEYKMKQTASETPASIASGRVLSRRALMAAATIIAAGMLPGTGHAVTIVKGTVIGQQDWLYLVWDDPRRADFNQMNRVTEIVEKAVATLRAARIDVVLAFVPAKSRVYRAFLPEDFRFTPETDRRYAVSLERLRKSGAIVPDLAEVFADMLKAKPDDKIFFKNDTHWTALGAEAAAKVIAQEMKAQLKLPPSPRPGANVGPAVTKVHVKSDLSLVLPPKEHPDESFQVHEVVAAKGKASLIDDDRPDVVVVGSSYMQPKYNFAEMLSNQLNRPVGLVWKVHLVGPYKTLLSYVTSDSFKKQRPRAIVWNFLEIDMELMPDSQAALRENAMPPEAFLSELAAAVKI
jgi:alginate O-acetyltransferase complex protein AlgJ